MRTHKLENITLLKENEIFVFGSNLAGEHIGGAARVANKEFEAEWGMCEGLTGRSYALPTLDENFQKVTEERLEKSFDNFFKIVEHFKEYDYILTKVGCGIAGWDLSVVKEIFWRAYDKRENKTILDEHIIIPVEFNR